MKENLPEEKNMAKQDKAKKPEEEKPLKSNKTPKNEKKRSGPGWIMWAITFIIALVGVGASAYLWQMDQIDQKQSQQLQTQLQAELNKAVEKIDKQVNFVRSTQQQLNSLNDSTRQAQQQQQQQTQQQITVLRNQLASQQKRLSSLSTTDRDDWLIAETEYLLRMANQRLLMSKDSVGAKELLIDADKIVRNLSDPALFPVRQALADEIAALHTVSRFDIEGVYLQIDAAATQAEQLKLFEIQLDTKLPPQNVNNGWRQRLESGVLAGWEKLKKYIQINRRDEIYKPILAPEYEPAVRQNLRLMFEQAQMSLLSGKQNLYEKSLGKAKDWLNTYYTLDRDATLKVLTIVNSLEQEKITRILPDISKSQRALNQYIEMLHLRGDTEKTKPKVSSSEEDTAESVL